jgi:hypothetical protein
MSVAARAAFFRAAPFLFREAGVSGFSCPAQLRIQVPDLTGFNMTSGS